MTEPVDTTAIRRPDLVNLHLYRDTCAGGYFITVRELERTLHEHVDVLPIRRDELPDFAWVRVAQEAASREADLVTRLESQEADLARLREAVEAAPHSRDCDVWQTGQYNEDLGFPCNCWKVDALGKEAQ